MTAYASGAVRPAVLASAGIATVGVSFGMARYGLGLLAPDMRSAFRLSHGSLGILSAASYVAYIATSVSGAALVVRVGARAVVATGGCCAVVGMLIAAAAGDPAVLFAGLLIAGASAGLVFPPFSDIVSSSLPPTSRSRVLTAISAGTGWGVALAAPVALLAGGSWRVAWFLFAVVAALATLWALAVLPPRGQASAREEIVRLKPSWFLCPRSGPLLIGALLIGLGSSVYWTFAVDHVQSDGGLTSTQGRLFLAVVGLASVAGSLSAQAIDRIGGRATFVLAAAMEAGALLLLGFVPDDVGAVFASALMFGAAYNALVAVTVIWGMRVFASRPSAGLAALMVMQAVGLLAGSPLLGELADRAGVPAIFAAAAALLLATSGLAPREDLRE